MSRTPLYPQPDSTEPRDEDLDLADRDDKGKWEPVFRSWAGAAVAISAASIVAGFLLGLTAATGWVVFCALTRSVR